VDLVQKFGGLCEYLRENLNGPVVVFESRVDHAAIVVVSHDLDGVGSLHHRGNWVLDELQSVLVALSLEAQLGRLGV